MEEPLANLIAAAFAFVGTHFALSHPLRAPLVTRIGAGAFQGLYSLVALATFAWLVVAFRAMPAAEPMSWEGGRDLAWVLASLIMLVASVLLVGSFLGNPALPAPNAKELASHRPKGIFKVTRHPMMWSFALWSLAHVLVSPTLRVFILAFAIGFLALVGAVMQDRKKIVLMGTSWETWERRTSYWPNLVALPGAGAVPWLGGIALWLVASWAHLPLIGMPAGIWRWI